MGFSLSCRGSDSFKPLRKQRRWRIGNLFVAVSGEAFGSSSGRLAWLPGETIPSSWCAPQKLFHEL
ncbi:hypothetical protein EC9_07690 [Rosistilla ulvae]|uniref:Uncharacterized protein n=1 Tax=Rosistilla ulvae TaxID=1930277 RepID=A0A517LVE3_9BACT|nr:hypothetical protein EC9_07690 [Rosistilla ulvae]